MREINEAKNTQPCNSLCAKPALRFGISVAFAFMVAAAFVLSLGAGPIQAYADDTTGNTLPTDMSYSTDVKRGPGGASITLPDETQIPNEGTDATQSVRQPDSGTARNFAAGLPLANIYIKEKFENEPQVRYENPCMKSVKAIVKLSTITTQHWPALKL